MKKSNQRWRLATQGTGAVPAHIPREPWFVLIALFLALGAYIGLAMLLPSPLAETSVTEMFIPEFREDVRPEPQERFLYILGLFCIPTLPGLFYWLLIYGNRRFDVYFSWLESPRSAMARDFLVAGGCLTWLFYLAAYSEIPHILPSLIIVLAGTLLLSGLMRWAPQSPHTIIYGLAGLLLLMLTYILSVSEDVTLSRFQICFHFDVLLGAINQVAHGRTILVDTISQYGILYPYIAVWALAPFELTPHHVMLFFVAVGFITLIFTYLALARKTGADSWLTLLFLLGVMGVQHPYFEAGLFDFDPPVAYYANYPLRVVCGAFFLWFVSVYFTRKSWPLALLGYAAAGVSILWNGESGMIILIAWTATLLFDAVATHAANIRKMLASAILQALLFSLTLLLSMGFYCLFAWLRSGQFPRFEHFYRFQKIFYAAGYYMLPMNLREFWQPIILVYVVTVFHCVRQLFQKKADAVVKWYFFIALYGLGIFSYYQGRSHIQCLPPVVYPAVILSGFWAVDFLQECRPASWRQLFTHPGYRYSFLRVTLCMLLPAFGIVNFFRFFPDATRYAMDEPKPPPIVARNEPLFSFLQKYVGNSETVILSSIANYLHMKTNSYSALPVCSPCEIVFLSQVQEVQNILDQNDLKYIVLNPVGGEISVMQHLRFDKFRIAARLHNFLVLEKNNGHGKP